MRDESYLTTGEIAGICKVAPRTVAKWIDGGALPGWQLPGSRDRRVKREVLVEFMRGHGMPIPPGVGRDRSVLLIGPDAASLTEAFDSAGWVAMPAMSSFNAGYLMAEHRPSAIVVDLSDGLMAAKSVAVDARGTPVVLLGEHERWTGLSAATGADAIEAVAREVTARRAAARVRSKPAARGQVNGHAR